ncbi:MAG: flagellar biosynthesis protein FlhB [Planctomycetota bacterium]
MPDDQDQEKTQDPTPKRRQEARQEGNVAKSQDLAASVVLAGSLIALWILGPRLWESILNVTFVSIAELPPREATRVEGVMAMAKTIVLEIALGMGPIMLVLAFAAVAGNVIQTGFLVAFKKLEPKAEILNPFAGAKKLFFAAKTYVGFAMNLMKLIAVTLVAWWAVSTELGKIVGLQRIDPAAVAPAAAMSVLIVAAKVAAALLLIAIIDFFYQRQRHEKDLRMTHQQVKDEMKKMEGDPEVKKRRRQIQMQQAMRSIAQDVPEADVVVTNPTHFAVAIKYDEDSMQAPRVVAKGADLMAQRIREVASANGVPIVERPPLARGLYGAIEVGQEIPEDFYAAVAELLAYVYRLERELAGAA